MKTVLVTGASSGIGAATVVRLVEDGYTVYAAARRLDRMRSLEEPGARVLQMDVTSEEDVRMVMDRIKAEEGGIDVLVNNAGFALYGAVEDVALEDARYQFEVNLFGLARLTQLALPYMRQRGKGTVVNVSSMGGKIWTPFGAWYHATKHALVGSPPAVIAATISAALKARRPKTRYVTGYGARMFLFLRRWTTDRIYDRIMRRFAG